MKLEESQPINFKIWNSFLVENDWKKVVILECEQVEQLDLVQWFHHEQRFHLGYIKRF